MSYSVIIYEEPTPLPDWALALVLIIFVFVWIVEFFFICKYYILGKAYIETRKAMIELLKG